MTPSGHSHRLPCNDTRSDLRDSHYSHRLPGPLPLLPPLPPPFRAGVGVNSRGSGSGT